MTICQIFPSWSNFWTKNNPHELGMIVPLHETHTNLGRDTPVHGTITYIPPNEKFGKLIDFKRCPFWWRGMCCFTSRRGVFTERVRGYDLLCIEGLVRALQVFKGVSRSDGSGWVGAPKKSLQKWGVGKSEDVRIFRWVDMLYCVQVCYWEFIEWYKYICIYILYRCIT